MAKLRYWSDRYILFQCPGCETPHPVRLVGPGPTWGWNQDMDHPTFDAPIIFGGEKSESRCHSTIREGIITFDSDSKHKWAGKGLTLEDWPQPDSI